MNLSVFFTSACVMVFVSASAPFHVLRLEWAHGGALSLIALPFDSTMGSRTLLILLAGADRGVEHVDELVVVFERPVVE